MQSESSKIREKFESEKRAWDRMYHREDYGSRGIQWRQRDGVALCRKHTKEGSYLLDLGCGCGNASVALAQSAYNVVGIDFSEGMIDRARVNASKNGLSESCKFEQADFVNEFSPSRPFDGLLALGFIEYFDNPLAVLKCMNSVLVEGGVAVVQIWNRRPLADTMLNPLYQWQQKLAHPIRFLKQSLETKGNERQGEVTTALPADVEHRRYTPSEFTELAGQAGFDLIDARGSLFFPPIFFLAEDRRATLDMRIQALAIKHEFIKKRAVNYIAVLKKA